MFRVVDDSYTIAKAQEVFLEEFELVTSKKTHTQIGHLGASYYEEVWWSDELGIWLCSKKIENRRYWNGFGTENPSWTTHVSITCEINFPLDGINRRVAGAFAKDEFGKLYVVHRGKLGGGRSGIGKALFEKNYSGTWAILEDGKIESKVAFIGEMGSQEFTKQIGKFVFEIERMKNNLYSVGPRPVRIIRRRRK